MRMIDTNKYTSSSLSIYDHRCVHLRVAVEDEKNSESYIYGVGYANEVAMPTVAHSVASTFFYIYELGDEDKIIPPYDNLSWVRCMVLQEPITKPIIRIEPINFLKHNLDMNIKIPNNQIETPKEEKEDITMYSYNGISGKFMKLILPNKSFGEMCVVVKGILFPTIVTQKFIDYHNKGGFKAIQVIGNWRSGTPTKVQALDPDWFPNASTTEYIYGAFVTRYEELKNVNLSHPIDIVDYSFLTQLEMERL